MSPRDCGCEVARSTHCYGMEFMWHKVFGDVTDPPLRPDDTRLPTGSGGARDAGEGGCSEGEACRPRTTPPPGVSALGQAAESQACAPEHKSPASRLDMTLKLLKSFSAQQMRRRLSADTPGTENRVRRTQVSGSSSARSTRWRTGTRSCWRPRSRRRSPRAAWVDLAVPSRIWNFSIVLTLVTQEVLSVVSRIWRP